MINGNNLIELGYKPARWFKEAIEHANSKNLVGDDLKSYLESVAPAKIVQIEPHQNPIGYHKNIVAETDDEIAKIK